MKKSVFILLAVLAGFVAQARSVMPFVKANIQHFELDEQLGKYGESLGGLLTVTPLNVTLHVSAPYPCEEGKACPAVMIDVISANLPIISRTQDNCGTTVIVAQKDQRPVDGSLQTITVLDHRSRVCEDYRPYATEIKYEAEAYGRSSVIKTESYMGGGRLVGNH